MTVARDSFGLLLSPPRSGMHLSYPDVQQDKNQQHTQENLLQGCHLSCDGRLMSNDFKNVLSFKLMLFPLGPVRWSTFFCSEWWKWNFYNAFGRFSESWQRSADLLRARDVHICRQLYEPLSSKWLRLNNPASKGRLRYGVDAHVEYSCNLRFSELLKGKVLTCINMVPASQPMDCTSEDNSVLGIPPVQ